MALSPNNQTLFELAKLHIISENPGATDEFIETMTAQRYTAYYQSINGEGANAFYDPEIENKKILDQFFASKGHPWSN